MRCRLSLQLIDYITNWYKLQETIKQGNLSQILRFYRQRKLSKAYAPERNRVDDQLLVGVDALDGGYGLIHTLGANRDLDLQLRLVVDLTHATWVKGNRIFAPPCIGPANVVELGAVIEMKKMWILVLQMTRCSGLIERAEAES